MHRTTTRRDLFLISAVLALFVLASYMAQATDKPPSLQSATPPTKAVTVAHSKPTLPDKTEEVAVSIPLSDEFVAVLVGACKEYGVPLALGVAVMERESNFNPDVVSPSGCYGLLQLNPDYFPSGLSPADNIRAGVGYLGELLATYDTTAAAVTAYFYGPSERVGSWYSDEVLERVEKWKEVTRNDSRSTRAAKAG